MKYLLNLFVLLTFSLQAMAIPPLDKEGREFGAPLISKELSATPGTPAAGKRKLYPKSDGFYQLDSTGTESKVGSGSGGVPNYFSANPDAEKPAITPWVSAGFVSSFLWNATVNTTNDTLFHFWSSTTGLPKVGDEVSFSGAGTPAAPLAINTTYYVAFVDNLYIKLSASRFGAIIDLTTTGSGAYIVGYGAPVGQRASAFSNFGTTLTVETVASGWAPIYDKGSFVFNKSAGNRMGDGFYFPITIQPGDLNKRQKVTFESGAATGTYNAGDVRFTIYDEVNKTRVVASDLPVGKTTATSETFGVEFQPATNSSSYSVWLTVASSNTAAYAIYFDNFQMGVQNTFTGQATSPRTAYTPIFTGLGTPTNVSFFWARDGEYAEIEGSFLPGTPTATLASISLPDNLKSALNLPTNGASNVYGAGILYYNGNIAETRRLIIQANSNVFNTSYSNGAGGDLTAVNGNTMFISGQAVNFRARVPIQGWQATATMSTDQIVPSIAAKISAPAGASADATAIKFPTKMWDDANAYNPITGLYTCQKTTRMRLTLNGFNNGSNDQVWYVKKTGVNYESIYQGTNVNVYANSIIVPVTKGDTLSITGPALNFGAAYFPTVTFEDASVTSLQRFGLQYSAPQIFPITSGSGTFNVPAGASYIEVQGAGAGGGGGGGGSSAGNGSSGGATTFGPFTANGGSFGTGNNANVAGGAGGSASLGGLLGVAIPGGNGNGAAYPSIGGYANSGGSGGVGFFGGAGASYYGGIGFAGATNSGAGGAGGGIGGNTGLFGGGGGGAGGYFSGTIPGPATSYSYSIGTGGTGGTAGGNGAAGGPGAAGILIIKVYFNNIGESSVPQNLVLSGGATTERFERVVSSTACTSSPCTLVNKTAGITNVTRVGTGDYFVNFATPYAALPTCVCSASTITGATRLCSVANTQSSASAVELVTTTVSVADDTIFSVQCFGPK